MGSLHQRHANGNDEEEEIIEGYQRKNSERENNRMAHKRINENEREDEDEQEEVYDGEGGLGPQPQYIMKGKQAEQKETGPKEEGNCRKTPESQAKHCCGFIGGH